MKTICTITTQSHLPQTLALRDSVMNSMTDVMFNVLVIDVEKINIQKSDKTTFFTLKDIENAYLTKSVQRKYAKNQDKLRWCLKPVFIHFLLFNCSYSKAIYVDNDIFFFNDFNFLYDALDEKDVLLCPHWRCTKPSISKEWFLVNFTDGFYNAGFFAASNKAFEPLKWWAEACLFKCAKIMRKGLFDDQKYLDFLPVIFENTGIIKHRGCNVAYWNQIENKRIVKESKVLINGDWEIIFIHFTKELIKSIKNNKDPHLKSYLNLYQTAIGNYSKQ